ncbi:MAG: hypothetical protein CMI32_01445 [Opitutales bacterium]|nr:hypothetical protein [Opitutales bacterium]
MSRAITPLLLSSFFLLIVTACGPSDKDPGGDSNTAGEDTVVILDPEVNGSFVTCSRVYEVDVSAWPSEGYPTGASGTYRHVSGDRYDGPKDGKMPDGASTGFYLKRQNYDDFWTIMSMSGIDGTLDGYPWDNQNVATDCPDGNASWINGAVVKAR